MSSCCKCLRLVLITSNSLSVTLLFYLVNNTIGVIDFSGDIYKNKYSYKKKAFIYLNEVKKSFLKFTQLRINIRSESNNVIFRLERMQIKIMIFEIKTK